MFPIMVPDMIAPNEEMKQLAGKIFLSLVEVKEWLQKEEIL